MNSAARIARLEAEVANLKRQVQQGSARQASPVAWPPIAVGQADEAITRLNTGTVRIYFGTTAGSETDTDATVEAFSRLANVVEDDWVLLAWLFGHWEIIATVGDFIKIGKTDSTHAKGASGVISIYSGTAAASITDSTTNLTAYNRFANIGSGKWVCIVRLPWGWEIIAAEC